ncbi:hypothetical protein BKA93DRAFT_240039 [Sparassis latifolia]
MQPRPRQRLPGAASARYCADRSAACSASVSFRLTPTRRMRSQKIHREATSPQTRSPRIAESQRASPTPDGHRRQACALCGPLWVCTRARPRWPDREGSRVRFEVLPDRTRRVRQASCKPQVHTSRAVTPSLSLSQPQMRERRNNIQLQALDEKSSLKRLERQLVCMYTHIWYLENKSRRAPSAYAQPKGGSQPNSWSPC